ncbi:peroxin 13 domain protein [Oesophagostomum dentatum]|uniref:Peroxin-13 n=1 Tax=Oesophagostomum dentatum TaxID=61180 RepID=A0A0B1RX96_OESDE|nr:peroxin 13 domain protein [Oesophagostomum dentatum]
MNPGGPSSSDPRGPPPLPPRPADSSTIPNFMPTYGMYGGGMGYGSAGYGLGPHMGMYGGMYGGGLYPSQYGNTGPDNSFARLAEESSRGAFQSIESVVNAVTSVANMLSSTHNAVYSSFRAVIGVVEQLSRLKLQARS